MAGTGILVVLLFYALIAYVLYWVVRLGVRHGIQDADRRRPALAAAPSPPSPPSPSSPSPAGPVPPPEDPAD